jgi:hypothetical protein
MAITDRLGRKRRSLWSRGNSSATNVAKHSARRSRSDIAHGIPPTAPKDQDRQCLSPASAPRHQLSKAQQSYRRRAIIATGDFQDIRGLGIRHQCRQQSTGPLLQ